MGIFGNVKEKITNLFTEEVEEEKVESKPVRREKKVEEPIKTRREEIKKEEKATDVSDSTVLEKQEKFKFPVYFSDEDFNDLKKPVKEAAPKRVAKPKEMRVPYQMKEEPTKKKFTPSKIISPVYGVLDENYSKEDIFPKKKKVETTYTKPSEITVDDIRNKAYGTLEDDLNDTLSGKITPVKEEKKLPISEENAIDIFASLEEEPTLKKVDLLKEEYPKAMEDTQDLSKELEKQKQKIEEINQFIKNNTMSREEKQHEEPKKETVTETENPEEMKEDANLVESELFNLIDSMYEKRDENE